jgi:sporulation protein YlmC with PRC-barrel domain
MGATVRCTNGVCGRLTQVVVDPIDDRVSHVIVEPEHRSGLGRLVPVDLIAESTTERVSLRCTTDEFERLPSAEKTQFLQGTEGFQGYEAENMLLWPYFGGNASVPVVVDTLPVGEVAVVRGEDVHASDGRIGHVDGLVIDGPNHCVSHVVLREGHIFGQKDVCIPIGAVKAVTEDGITLSISKAEVDALPPVKFDRPGGK